MYLNFAFSKVNFLYIIFYHLSLRNFNLKNMTSRRKFITQTALATAILPLASVANSVMKKRPNYPLVISTWDAGLRANTKAWELLSNDKSALDAVEQGVMITESEINCCVGLNGNPDREGIVTLDASIMDEQGNCGSVAALEQIEHPISVARKVMENSPHVMLVGQGAQQFAMQNGFQLMPKKLSDDAEKNYKEWLKKSEYKPIMNIENSGNKKHHKGGPNAPDIFENGEYNHDTIAMLALDSKMNISGSCTTSGMGFKYRGRVGDSPIIGAGLFVDNEIGAAAATGHGEEVIRIAGSHLVVELMRQGKSPKEACKAALERAVKMRGKKLKDKQIAFIAINKNGEAAGYALRKGFSYALYSPFHTNELINADFLLE
jgi:N4-(beta-N-acetylglucosaminyl)-L-asparaginase